MKTLMLATWLFSEITTTSFQVPFETMEKCQVALLDLEVTALAYRQNLAVDIEAGGMVELSTLPRYPRLLATCVEQ